MKQTRNILIFTLIGITLLLIPIVTSPDFNRGIHIFDIPPFQRNFIAYLLLLIYFFLNYFVFIPKFYTTERWFMFTGVTIISFVIITFIPEIAIHARPPAPEKLPPPGAFRPGPKQGFILQFALVFILSLLMRIQHRVSELKNEKISAELSYLKAKINPHFLFNTLNSIYALALIQNKNTPNAILKLSSLMRYVVSESESQKVSLKKEITYIEDYIELQKLRFSDKVEFNYKFEGNTDGLEIAPLILINYIENAFKFGLHTEKKCRISVEMEVKNSTIILNTKNLIVYKAEDLAGTEEGLQNSKNRLELLYSGKYSLREQEKNGTYLVELKINLA